LLILQPQKIESYNIGIKAPLLGLAYLALVLETKGHDVRIIDEKLLKIL